MGFYDQVNRHILTVSNLGSQGLNGAVVLRTLAPVSTGQLIFSPTPLSSTMRNRDPPGLYRQGEAGAAGASQSARLETLYGYSHHFVWSDFQRIHC
jgi:hypothetical protein